MTQIRSLFDPDKGIHRSIEKVISYQASQEERLKAEIREYVVTESIEHQLERLLENIQAAMESGGGHEVGVWVSGFYGSGKSSFTKYLGLAFDQHVQVDGQPFLRHLQDRLHKPTTKALLSTVSARFPAAVVMLDLASEQIAGATLAEVSTVLYYKVLQYAGYSRNLKVAALERKLKKNGRFAEFEALFHKETGEAWADYRNDELVADSVLPTIAHQLYPALFRNDQAFTTASSDVIYLMDDRVQEMIDIVREASGKEYIVFVIDEIGQYVGSYQTKILDLQGLAEKRKASRRPSPSLSPAPSTTSARPIRGCTGRSSSNSEQERGWRTARTEQNFRFAGLPLGVLELKGTHMKTALATAIAALVALSGSASGEISGDVVKIGVLNDMSGLFADTGGRGSVEAARMAIADFGSTVNGKKIELVIADHQNKPDIGSAIANQWFDNDGIDAIVDVPNSGVALSVQEIARSKNKVFLISSSAASDLTGKACSPTSVHWTYNTVALANGTGSATVKAGGDTWFFITADYAFGHALERDTAKVVEANGGKVLGRVRVPLNTPDFSSFLLQAQASKAKIIGLANSGGDTINSIKQAAEFGIVEGGQKLAGLLVFISDIHSLGLQTAHGLQLTESFYWDQNAETRAWSERFFDKMRRQPTMAQAGVYGAVMDYLAAVKATNSDDGATVVKQMKAMPVNDFMTKNGKIREDGTLVRDMYLFEVKKPSESKGPWDYYKQIAVIPGEEAFKLPGPNQCPLVKG